MSLAQLLGQPSITFQDRTDAGQQLAKKLEKYQNKGQVIIYAIPRGGVVLGVEIARHLKAPLDLIITRKIGHPWSPEYAVGIVSEDGHSLFNEQEKTSLDPQWLEKVTQEEIQEAQRRRQTYLKDKPSLKAKNKIAILVDDGVATGLSFRLAIQELKHRQPKKLIAAIPVAPKDTAEQIKSEVDELIILEAPENYVGAVGAYYQKFDQVSDEQVIQLLQSIKPNTS